MRWVGCVRFCDWFLCSRLFLVTSLVGCCWSPLADAAISSCYCYILSKWNQTWNFVVQLQLGFVLFIWQKHILVLLIAISPLFSSFCASFVSDNPDSHKWRHGLNDEFTLLIVEYGSCRDVILLLYVVSARIKLYYYAMEFTCPLKSSSKMIM